MIATPAAADVVVTSRWQVADRRAQRAAADSAMARLRDLPWPDGCHSVACLLSTDGQLIVFYHRWKDEDSYRRYAASVGADEPGLDMTRLDTVVSRLADAPGDMPGDCAGWRPVR